MIYVGRRRKNLTRYVPAAILYQSISTVLRHINYSSAHNAAEQFEKLLGGKHDDQQEKNNDESGSAVILGLHLFVPLAPGLPKVNVGLMMHYVNNQNLGRHIKNFLQQPIC